ncbi:MAG: AMP-binding protein [Bacteroidia bacterium]|nr:AMP-binding protein [Bacteroidia bacterium]MCF8426255.1 AMP-binding protein [Bacteroidia bacterium]MCF8445460.1 AMP-binding protein [Bacteroidia bacterium]
MAFSIIYSGSNFSLTEFCKESFEQDFLIVAQDFLSRWQNNHLFTFFSSGTTGSPKQFSFEKWQLIKSATATINALSLIKGEEHLLLCIHPKFIGGAMMLARALILDCEVTLFAPQSNIFDFIPQKHPYSFVSLVPLQVFNTKFDIDKFNQFRNVLIGGSSISKDLINKLSECKPKVFHTYATTETLSHVALKRLYKDIGYRVLPDYSVEIDSQNRVCISTPFLDQQLVTNDIGNWIKPNEFEILGRVDFAINSGGIKIQPENIEKVLEGLEWFKNRGEFYIGKAKDSILGEKIVLVVDFPLNDFEWQKLKDYLHSKAIKYELPKQVLQISQFPITESGKLNRRKLNEWIDYQQNIM